MTGNTTTVPMKVASGGTVPSVIHLADSSAIFPDASGQFLVPSTQVVAMLSAGFQIVVSSGTTHVP